jgi:hypothetical protein
MYVQKHIKTEMYNTLALTTLLHVSENYNEIKWQNYNYVHEMNFMKTVKYIWTNHIRNKDLKNN